MIKMDENTEPSKEIILKLINEHSTSRGDRLRSYYDGNHDIVNRTFADTTKPNNRIVTNFCKYISDVATGHFIANPVSYSTQDKDFEKDLQDIFNYNDEQHTNYELASQASIQAVAYELLYSDESEEGKAIPRFAPIDLREQSVILVFDRSISPKLLFAIRYYTTKDMVSQENAVEAFVYTKDSIYTYEIVGATITLKDEEEHFFKEVPLNWYYNKEQNGKSDFEDIMHQNDAYNLLQSDDVNESNYSNDAYLIIKNMVADNDDIAAMKERRAIEVGEDGDVRWLIKEINDTWKENMKTRLATDIHKISAVPDMTDEKFSGNASGVALEYKLLAFENNRGSKERMFKKGLQRRIKLICNFLAMQSKNYDWREVEMTFTANLPENIKDEVEAIEKLIGTGLVSKDTLRNKLSFISDSAMEEEKLEEESVGMINLDAFAEGEADDS